MYNYKWVLYMEQYYGLILTFITGLFFLIGGLISIKIKQKEKVYAFSIALAFVVIINLLIGDLIPEISELVENYELSTTNTKFDLYIWLDGNESSNDVINKSFGAYISASAVNKPANVS